MKFENDAILLVDKPAGMSSAHVVARAKRLFGAKKVGHTGTLDPFATGLVILTLNRATRVSRYFLGGDKTYEATLKLGVLTDTLDPEGTVTKTAPVPEINAQKLLEVLSAFTGEILQTPPIYSALKHEGKPLYQHAREGNAVVKPPRKVTIHDLRLISANGDEIRFEVSCSSGTYVRTLGADIADALGTVGHLTQLRRTSCCGLDVEDAHTLESLMDAREAEAHANLPTPMNACLDFLPEIPANKALTELAIHGRVIRMGDIESVPEGEGPIRLVGADGSLLAVVRKDETDPGRLRYDAVFN